MSTIRCIHIAPELPPTVGGVADYTAILSQRLEEVSGGAVEPVYVHAGKDAARAIESDFPVVDLSGRCSAAALAGTIRKLAGEAKKGAIVLLEYSEYGYAKRSAPLWLLRGIRRTCGDGSLPLVSVLHELYATGPPWTSAFWYSVPKRYVTGQLARMSASVVTNRENAKPWLRQSLWAGIDEVIVQPVFSNVGEPDELPAFGNRSPKVVLFGGSGRKSRFYDEDSHVLRALLDQVEGREIIDIGPSVSDQNSNPEVRQCGVLPAPSVSKRLLQVSLGALSYPASRLGKSGVAAAFASHGVPFVLLDEDRTGETTAPYEEGLHFWRWSTLDSSRCTLSHRILSEASRSIRTLYMKEMHSMAVAQSVARAFDVPMSSSHFDWSTHSE